MRKIVGLVGKARAGKNTMADLFCEEENFTQLAFAGALYQVLLATDPWVEVGEWNFVRLSVLDEELGYEHCKTNFPDVREYLKKLGTEGARHHISPTVWLDIVRNQIVANPNTNYVITDIRFDNECAMIQDQQGIVVKLERPSHPGTDQHQSENIAAIHADLNYCNDGSLDDMRVFVKYTLELLNGGS